MRTSLWLNRPPDFLEALEKEPVSISSDESCTDASVFLHGICGVFALALRDKFGYGIYYCADETGEDNQAAFRNAFHVYCVDEDSDAVIDVRGVTDDMDEFLEEFEDFFTEYLECSITREACERELLEMMPQAVLNDCYAAAMAYIEVHENDFKIE